MDADHAAPIDPGVFERNLAALRDVDPATAERLATVPIPPAVTPCRGRDGAWTFRIAGDDGREHWLGGTSAPSVSAPAMLSAFDAGSGNILLFEIGQGAEVARLLTDLGRHRGVLVIEADPLRAALAFRLHDYAADIRSMRLALLLAPFAEAEERLTDFLLRHDGYCYPERMLVWPWEEPARVPLLRAIIERAATAATRDRAQKLTTIQAEWPCGLPTELASPPRLAVVGLMATRIVADWVGQAASAARELGWAAEAVALRGPGECHVLHYAEAINRFRPDLILAVRTGRCGLEAAIPPGIPVTSWLDPVGPAADSIRTALGQADIVATTSAGLRHRLTEAGIAEDQLCVVPLAASAVGELLADGEDRPYDAIVVGDVISARPTDSGVELHTQQSLWRECLRAIEANPDGFADEKAESLLSDAERRLGIQIREPDVRDAFVSIIRETLGPSAVMTGTLRSLVKTGLRIGVYGAGWHHYADLKAFHLGTDLDLCDATSAFRAAKAYVRIGTTAEVDARTLDAAASGVPVLWREHRGDREAGGIATMFDEGIEYLAFRTASDLARKCRNLIFDSKLRRSIGAAAAARSRREHGMTHRIQRLFADAADAIRRARRAENLTGDRTPYRRSSRHSQ